MLGCCPLLLMLVVSCRLYLHPCLIDSLVFIPHRTFTTIIVPAGICGATPPPDRTCDNVTLPQAVGFIDKVCSYSFAALNKASGTLAVVHQGMYPNKTTPSNIEGLAAPFGSGSSIMTDYTHAQMVRGSDFTFQLLLGHQIACDYDKAVGEFPKRPDGKTASLSHVKSEASCLAEKLVTTYQKRVAPRLSRLRLIGADPSLPISFCPRLF